MAYIYKITNNINNKIYIGKTIRNIKERFLEHCRDSKKETEQNRPLYRAMNKYGIKNFSIELIEETNNPEEREKYWIEYYGSFKDGYNATTGGDGKPYLDYELIYITYKETKSIKKTANIVGCDKDMVSLIIKNIYNISQEEIFNNYLAVRSKPVAMINSNGEIQKTFASTHDAGRFLKKSHQHIQECCQGKRKSAYGYSWKYI